MYEKKSGKPTAEDGSLFTTTRKMLRFQHFSTPEEAVDAFRMHVLEIPYSEWQKYFDNWFKSMQKCIDLNGEYFEKQKSNFR